jgi:hypothetical protein
MPKKAEKQDFSQVIGAIKDLKEEFDEKLKELKVAIEKKQDKGLIDVSLNTKTDTTGALRQGEVIGTAEKVKFPVPKEYVMAVEEILSGEFGINIIPHPQMPQFELQILVPKQYSNAPEEIWKDVKADIRSKVITYGEGIGGVRTYIELVKSNLGAEINAKIKKDKEQK